MKNPTEFHSVWIRELSEGHIYFQVNSFSGSVSVDQLSKILQDCNIEPLSTLYKYDRNVYNDTVGLKNEKPWTVYLALFPVGPVHHFNSRIFDSFKSITQRLTFTIYCFRPILHLYFNVEKIGGLHCKSFIYCPKLLLGYA